MQSAETLYAGTYFRSRLVARWAALFDIAEIEWAYEPEEIKLSSGTYIPDFWLPCQQLMVEVKPACPVNGQIKKYKEAAKSYPLLLLCKQPYEHTQKTFGQASSLSFTEAQIAKAYKVNWTLEANKSSPFNKTNNEETEYRKHKLGPPIELNDRAWDYLEKYRPMWLSVCRRYTKNSVDAEELFHDTVIGAVLKANLSYKDELGGFEKYMYKCVTNRLIDRYRRKKSRAKTVTFSDLQNFDHTDHCDEIETIIESENFNYLMEKVKEYDQNCYTVLYAYVVERMNISEIALKYNKRRTLIYQVLGEATDYLLKIILQTQRPFGALEKTEVE